jgi:hypothetical protein
MKAATANTAFGFGLSTPISSGWTSSRELRVSLFTVITF